ncbi:hypothetical protein AAFP30_15265 [Gordonia sp. CPCC 205515]|uniref:hypothetical protein n=1 Tax=Gordonia sp. CPCC 205515 TaxID=3140791 RepID=UPI003AF39761
MSVLRKTARRSAGSATKVAAVAAFGIAVALGTSACGAGQISQTANQEPAVNGNLANIGDLQLRDVQILYPTDKADEVFGNGGPFQLAFVINNLSPVNEDRLVAITAPEGGSVTIAEGSDGAKIPAGQALRAGKPAGLLIPEEVQSRTEQRISVVLNNAGDTVAAGLTTPLVFRFEKAGIVAIRTPVDSGSTLPRQDKIREAEAPADEHTGGH